MCSGNSWRRRRAETPLSEGADQPGQCDLRRIVDQEMDVVGPAVELGQCRAEVRTDIPHDLLAPGEDLVGERAAPVLRSEDQVDMEGVDNRSTPPQIGVWLPSR